MNKILLTFTIFVFIFSFTIVDVFAAEVTTSVPSEIKAGESFSVMVAIDTDDELVNAVDFSIDYPEELISFVGYKDTNTVLKVWIGSPKAESGKVSFSGIIPGGVSSFYDPTNPQNNKIPLVELTFKANKSGEGRIDFLKTEVLKNDGAGSPLVHTKTGSTVLIQNTESSSDLVTAFSAEQSTEQEPAGTKPEPFQISFLPSFIFSKTPPMIVFSTTDLDEGIQKYEISTKEGEWHEAQSPAPVKLGFFQKEIKVRAYDFSSNWQESSIVIPGFISTQVIVLILVIIFLIFLGFKLKRHK